MRTAQIIPMRRPNERIQKLKLIFDEMARFCDGAHTSLKGDDAAYKEAWIINKRVHDLIAVAVSKDRSAEDLVRHAPQIIVSIDQMLDALAKKFSPAAVSILAKKSFQMPPRIPGAPYMTLVDKRVLVQEIGAVKLAVLLR